LPIDRLAAQIDTERARSEVEYVPAATGPQHDQPGIGRPGGAGGQHADRAAGREHERAADQQPLSAE